MCQFEKSNFSSVVIHFSTQVIHICRHIFQEKKKERENGEKEKGESIVENEESRRKDYIRETVCVKYSSGWRKRQRRERERETEGAKNEKKKIPKKLSEKKEELRNNRLSFLHCSHIYL